MYPGTGTRVPPSNDNPAGMLISNLKGMVDNPLALFGYRMLPPYVRNLYFAGRAGVHTVYTENLEIPIEKSKY